MTNKYWVFSEDNGPHIKRTTKIWSDEQRFNSLDDAKGYAIKWAEEEIRDLQECINFWRNCKEEDFGE